MRWKCHLQILFSIGIMVFQQVSFCVPSLGFITPSFAAYISMKKDSFIFLQYVLCSNSKNSTCSQAILCPVSLMCLNNALLSSWFRTHLLCCFSRSSYHCWASQRSLSSVGGQTLLQPHRSLLLSGVVLFFIFNNYKYILKKIWWTGKA